MNPEPPHASTVWPFYSGFSASVNVILQFSGSRTTLGSAAELF